MLASLQGVAAVGRGPAVSGRAPAGQSQEASGNADPALARQQGANAKQGTSSQRAGSLRVSKPVTPFASAAAVVPRRELPSTTLPASPSQHVPAVTCPHADARALACKAVQARYEPATIRAPEAQYMPSRACSSDYPASAFLRRGSAALPVPGDSIERTSSSRLHVTVADGDGAAGDWPRAPLSERASLLAAFYARSPAASIASSSGEASPRRRSVSRRRSQHPAEGGGGTLARSCPVPSAFAAAAAETPFAGRGGRSAPGSGARDAGSDSESSDW